MYGARTQGQPVGGQSFTERMIGAARIDRSTYEEVEHDTSATTQAAMIVVIAAIAGAIGGAGHGWNGVVAGLLGALLGWVVSSVFIYLVGTRFIPAPQTEADLGQVLRTQGFAAVPTFLLIFGGIPVLGGIIALIVGIWYIITRIVGIQSALEASSGRAIVIAILAVVLQTIVIGILSLIFGVGLFALGSLS